MSKQSKCVLITGATGALGFRVVHSFHEAGFIVRTFSLDPPWDGIFPSEVENIIGDITNIDAVASAMKGIDCVVHMAALLHIDEPPLSMLPMYEQINVNGTASIVEASIRKRIRRIVFFSTIAVYAPGKGDVLSEETLPAPASLYARTKLKAEQKVLAVMGVDGRAVGCVLRLGAVYGVRVKGNYKRLVRALARRCFVPVGDGKNRRTLVYDRDVGTAALLAATNPIAAGRIYNVTDGQLHTLNEIIETICSILDRKPPRFSLPARPTRALIGIIEKGSRTFGFKPPVTGDMIAKYTEDMAVDGTLIQKELAFVPKYDIRTGWKETIEEMRARGEL